MIKKPNTNLNKRRSRGSRCADVGSPVKKAKPSETARCAKLIQPDTFEDKEHFYPRVLNATVHPMVESFMKLGNDRIIERYIHMHPQTNGDRLREIFSATPAFFRWSGADLFKVVDEHGNRQLVIIETNSCPSGQKSMPGTAHESSRGYHQLMREAFLPMVEEHKDQLAQGGRLAVIYDKNPMEASGYAAALADEAKEEVLLAEFYQNDPDPPVKFVKKVMQVRDGEGKWHPIRAAFRYVTQKPWNRLPLDSKTLILNSTLCCLAGGRNKMAADKAYEFFNNLEKQSGLHINVPETQRDVCKEEVPLWVKSMGGHAVVKVPYSNAGQGVYTITNQKELDAMMAEPDTYNKYIVQSLIGNCMWSSQQSKGKFYHCGSIPNKKNQIFCSDLRMMVMGTKQGLKPLAIYARQARKPLVNKLTPDSNSWDILGTNLSVKLPDGSFTTESERLRLMDTKDFNTLGLGLDDLIEAYVQTVLATTAIDNMAQRLTSKGWFDSELYASVNSDETLLQEIIGMPPVAP